MEKKYLCKPGATENVCESKINETGTRVCMFCKHLSKNTYPNVQKYKGQ